MDDLGVTLTNRRMRALDKRLQSIYTQAYKEAIKQNEKWIDKLASLPEDAPPEKRLAFAREVERTSHIVDNIAADLAGAGKEAAAIIQGEMNNVWGLNYDYTAYDVSKQTGLSISFNQYDKNQIAVIVSGEQSPFTKIAYKRLGSDKIITQRLGNELAIAIINGESQQQIIRRIRNVTGQSVKQARGVAQTERTRVQSQGRNMGILEAEAMGVKLEKQWIARMINTRDTHTAQNGEIVAVSEKFSNGLMYPGDPSGSASEVCNCHCYEKPKVISVSPVLTAHREKFGNKTFKG